MSGKILVVDDSSTMRRINNRILKGIGITEMDEAENGVEALKKVASDTFDLILLDINMPVMDGFECLVELKKNEKSKDIPVIMVTSESKKEDIMKAIGAGASDYLSKPFDPDVLKEKISHHIELP